MTTRATVLPEAFIEVIGRVFQVPQNFYMSIAPVWQLSDTVTFQDLPGGFATRDFVAEMLCITSGDSCSARQRISHDTMFH